MSDWLEFLAKACEETSQRAVGARIGYSSATVSLVLGGQYKGDMNAVKNAVATKLMQSTVPCPVLGEIKSADCSAHQKRSFSSSSSMRVRLFKACRKCPFNTRRKETP